MLRARNNQDFLVSFLFPILVHSAITLKVEGDATIDLYKPVSWTRSATDPETFLLVNVVLDKNATQGTQVLLHTNGTTSGISLVVAHFPGTHHVLAFLNASNVIANIPPLAASNNFGVIPASQSSTSSSTTATTDNSVPATIVTVTPNASTTVAPASRPSPHSNTPVLVGGIVGGVVIVALIAAAIWYSLRRRGKTNLTEDSTTVTHPFALQPLQDPAPHQVASFRTEKSRAQRSSMLTETQNVSRTPSHHQLLSSSVSKNGSIPTPTITEVGHHQVLPPLPDSTIPKAPTREVDGVTSRLNEAVAEIAGLRGELRSLRDTAWTSHAAVDISPPSYDYTYGRHE